MAVTGSLFAVALFGLGCVGNYFYDFALNPHAKQDEGERMKTLTETEEMTAAEKEAKSERKIANKWLRQHSYPDYLTSRDGLSLHAYRIDQPGHDYVIICHGYKNQGSYMGLYAKQFYDMGFHILAPDARGHGKSEGDYIGMGWPERLDVADWCAHIAREDPEARIVLFGVSMGAATVLMASGEPLVAQVRLVIEDCGYTSVWDEFREQLRQMFHTSWFPILPAADLVCRIRAGYGFYQASALEQVKKCELPILFIHGEDDTFVPFSMMETLYQAASGEKEKLAIPGAGHAGSAQTNPQAYWGAIKAFLQKYLIPRDAKGSGEKVAS